jgi:hypothetical protein
MGMEIGDTEVKGDMDSLGMYALSGMEQWKKYKEIFIDECQVSQVEGLEGRRTPKGRLIQPVFGAMKGKICFEEDEECACPEVKFMQRYIISMGDLIARKYGACVLSSAETNCGVPRSDALGREYRELLLLMVQIAGFSRRRWYNCVDIGFFISWLFVNVLLLFLFSSERLLYQ